MITYKEWQSFLCPVKINILSELPKLRKNKNLYDLYHVRVKRNLPAVSDDTLLSGDSSNTIISQSDSPVKPLFQSAFMSFLFVQYRHRELLIFLPTGNILDRYDKYV